MKKWIAFVMALFFTVSAICFAWMRIGGNSSITYVHIVIPVIFGALCVKIYRTHKKAEQSDSEKSNSNSLPSLAEVAQMEDEAKLNSYITNFTKSELKVVWGEPNESSTTEDVWYINDNTKLIVNYHNNDDKAVICGIERTD